MTPDRPILLVGLPGAGKSTIAPLLAARLGLPSHDSDALIEAGAECSVAALLTESEARFRAEERQVLARLLAGPPAVIAAGGGAWLDPDTRALALSGAITIWLDVDVEVLAQRLGDARDRPLLAGNLRARLATLKASRDPLYALAPIRIPADAAPEAVAGMCLAQLAQPVR